MVYDTSDVRSTWKVDFNKDGNHDFALAMELGLSHSWFAGGVLYKTLRRLDACGGFADWIEALTWVASYREDEPISEIQFWGHGSPGCVWMKNEALAHFSTDWNKQSATTEALWAIRSRLRADSLIWFRTCSTFAGEKGQQFAKAWATGMNCRVAGHTHIIGLLQSGLRSIVPEQEPSWPSDEGILQGTPARPTRMQPSSLRAKNTITCLHGDVPEGW
jgi:hypothetical protein